MLKAIDYENVAKYWDYVREKHNKLIILRDDCGNITVRRQLDASRYRPLGRKKIMAKIINRMGIHYHKDGLMMTLTFDPKKISREDAWKNGGSMASSFMRKVNMKRKYWHMKPARYIRVLEPQPSTGYPHYHYVFPGLKFLAPIKYLTKVWNMADNSVDIEVKDSISPAGYACKYISKLSGWDDLSLSYAWLYKTRIYTMSRDYIGNSGGDAYNPRNIKFVDTCTSFTLFKQLNQMREIRSIDLPSDFEMEVLLN